MNSPRNYPTRVGWAMDEGNENSRSSGMTSKTSRPDGDEAKERHCRHDVRRGKMV